MRKALIVGTGGHCRALLSLLATTGQHLVLGVLDIAEHRPGEVIMGAAVIGSTEILEKFQGREDVDVFLAIGDNDIRRKWWQTVDGFGMHLPNLISPHAIVDPEAQLGKANIVCARSFLGPEVKLGDNNLVNTAGILEHEVQVGSHCHLSIASTIAGRCRISNSCFIGAGATVIDNIRIASHVTIGAGAVVVSNIKESGGKYIGVPARKM